MSQDKDYLKIKDVTEMLDTEDYILRFYEKELGLKIKRNKYGHRVYTLEDVETFKKIQDLREKGIQLKAIENMMHETDNEIKESLEQITSVQLAPVPAQTSTSLELDIGDPDNAKMQQFVNLIKQAVMECNAEAHENLKDKVKAELAEEVHSVVDEKINKLQEEQDAKSEAYYKKLDETIREVQKMRRQLNDSKEEEEDEKKKKLSLFSKLFRGRKEAGESIDM